MEITDADELRRMVRKVQRLAQKIEGKDDGTGSSRFGFFADALDEMADAMLVAIEDLEAVMARYEQGRDTTDTTTEGHEHD
jgi:hypothetical protein